MNCSTYIVVALSHRIQNIFSVHTDRGYVKLIYFLDYLKNLHNTYQKLENELVRISNKVITASFPVSLQMATRSTTTKVLKNNLATKKLSNLSLLVTGFFFILLTSWFYD